MARVLTIEDDQAIRTLLAAQLGERGHELIGVADGESGLRIAYEAQPDVILLDLGLPGLHGTAVLDRLKSDPATRAIPVIIVSAWAEGHASATALARGAAGVLRKPFAARDLYALVDAALAGRAAAND